MDDINVVLIIAAIIFVCFIVSREKKNPDIDNEENKEIKQTKEDRVFKKTLILLLSYKEVRVMLVACMIIYFTSTVLPSKIDITIYHDFGGNKYNPISFQLSDPGYPIRFEVRNT